MTGRAIMSSWTANQGRAIVVGAVVIRIAAGSMIESRTER
jgi:hypothetical protein